MKFSGIQSITISHIPVLWNTVFRHRGKNHPRHNMGFFSAIIILFHFAIITDFYYAIDSNENENMKRSGERVWISWTNKPILDANGDVTEILCIGNDITESKKIEAELQKMQKLESMGVLAGGIAHDFNNILTAILGNISLARIYAESGGTADKVMEKLTAPEMASAQAQDLTQQLLTFARGGAPIKKMSSVAELLRDSVISISSGSNVKCEFSIPDDLWAAEVDEGQMNQVISNIVINAEQAMPNGEVIDVCADNVIVSAEPDIPLAAGVYVKISISDHGVGLGFRVVR